MICIYSILHFILHFLQIYDKIIKRKVIIMAEASYTNGFQITYTESKVEHPILWESHCHTQFEMIAVAEGDVTVTLEDQGYRLTKNQVMMIPPLFYHSVNTNSRGKYRRMTVLFTVDAIPKAWRGESIEQGRVAEISGSDIERIREISQKENPSFYAPLITSLMIQMLYNVLEKKQLHAEPVADEFLQKTLRYIDEHLNQKITLDELARHTARSKSSFCHMFEKKMNISPKQYILQKKLALASKLIDEGVPHTVAAMRVGFDYYSNFYRLYRKNIK